MAAANRGMRQDDARLRVQQLIRTNISPHSEVQPRARTPHTDWVVPDNLPHNLFMPEVTIDTERHGPYAAVIRNKYRHTAISRTATTVTISNIQFWDALLEWFDLNVDDFNRYLQGHQKHRIRATTTSTVRECYSQYYRVLVRLYDCTQVRMRGN